MSGRLHRYVSQRSTPRRLLVFFTLAQILIYYDRGLIAGFISHIQEDFRISDTLAGVLGSGFIFGFTVAAPVFAHLSKHYSPYKLMSIGLFIWCGACVLCGMSYEYWVLLLARIITGVGEASFAGTFVQLVL